MFFVVSLVFNKSTSHACFCVLVSKDGSRKYWLRLQQGVSKFKKIHPSTQFWLSISGCSEALAQDADQSILPCIQLHYFSSCRRLLFNHSSPGPFDAHSHWSLSDKLTDQISLSLPRPKMRSGRSPGPLDDEKIQSLSRMRLYFDKQLLISVRQSTHGREYRSKTSGTEIGADALMSLFLSGEAPRNCIQSEQSQHSFR